MPVNLDYPRAECPKCGEPIDDDKEAGDGCDGCDYVFVENYHEHKWGPVERSRFAGTPHRKCQVSGCDVIDLDLDDGEEEEELPEDDNGQRAAEDGFHDDGSE